MKTLLLRSLLAALLFAPLVSFANSIIWTRVRFRYDPPLTEAEYHQIENRTGKEIEAELKKREVRYTKSQWLSDSVREPYLWTDLAKASIVPAPAIFLACLLRRRLGASSQIRQ
jgi:hypothetical protein